MIMESKRLIQWNPLKTSLAKKKYLLRMLQRLPCESAKKTAARVGEEFIFADRENVGTW
jgi:hypothetical protein